MSRRDQNLIRVLLGVVVIFVLAHVVSLHIGDRYWQVERMFNLNLESNIPTWFSSFLLILGALSAFRCAQHSLMVAEERGWLVIGCALLFLSCDEIAMLHEYLGKAIGKRIFLIWPQASSILHASPWLAGCAPFILIGVLTVIFAMGRGVHTSRLVTRYLTTGLILYGLGSVGCGIAINFFDRASHVSFEWLWQMEIIIEESLEMIGTITILAGTILHHQYLEQRLRQLTSTSVSKVPSVEKVSELFEQEPVLR